MDYGSFIYREGLRKKDEGLQSLRSEKPVTVAQKKTESKKTALEHSKVNVNQKTKINTQQAVKTSKTLSVKTNKSQNLSKSKHEKKSLGKNSQKPFVVKTSIGAKLIGIISAIVSISLILITVLVSYYISSDTRVNAEENNLTINSRTAADTQSRFNSVIASAGTFYDNISSDDEAEELQNKAARFFERNSDLIAMKFIYDDKTFLNNKYFVSRELDSQLVHAYADQEFESIDSAKNGMVSVLNACPFFENQILAIFTPIRSDDN